MSQTPAMQRSAILGVGHYVPTRVVTNHDLSKLMTTSDEWIVQRTGIRERRYIEHSGIGASELAVPACRMALEHAEVAAKDIDAIVFATLSPDHNFPGSGCFLARQARPARRARARRTKPVLGVPLRAVRGRCVGARRRIPARASRRRRGALDGDRVLRSRPRRGGPLRRRRRRGGHRRERRAKGRASRRSVCTPTDRARATCGSRRRRARTTRGSRRRCSKRGDISPR